MKLYISQQFYGKFTLGWFVSKQRFLVETAHSICLMGGVTVDSDVESTDAEFVKWVSSTQG
jgi:hypothetical protein